AYLGSCYWIERICENNTLTGNTADGGRYGLFSYAANNNTFRNMGIGNSNNGIRLEFSSFHQFQDIVISNNSNGFSFLNSNGNSLDNLSIINGWSGGVLTRSDNNSFTDLSISVDEQPLSLDNSDNNNFEVEIDADILYPAAYIFESSGNRFENGSCTNMDGPAFQIMHSKDNVFHNINTYSGNQNDIGLVGESYGNRFSSLSLGGYGFFFNDAAGYIYDRDKLYSSTEITDTFLIGRGEVYFLTNTDYHGSEPVSDAGQIILYNVSNAVIDGEVLDWVIEGLKIVNSIEVTVKDCVQKDTKYYGWTVLGSTRIRLVDNDFFSSNYSKMLLSLYNNDLLLEGNSFHDSAPWYNKNSFLDGDLFLGYSTDAVISGNSFERIDGTALVVDHCDNATFYGNRYEDLRNGSIIRYSNRININNEDMLNIKNIGITLLSSNHIDINDISVMNCSLYGISGQTNYNLTLGKSRIFDNNYGIYGSYIWESTITDLVVYNNRIGGFLENSYNLNIEGNLFYDNSGPAVHFGIGSKDIDVHGNSFIRNNGAGFDINDAVYQLKLESSGRIDFDRDGSGNHWSNWRFDRDMDDIVDDILLVPSPGNHADNYPLMRSPHPLISQPRGFHVALDRYGIDIEWQEPDYVYSSPIDGFALYRSIAEGPPEIIGYLSKYETSYRDQIQGGGIKHSYYLVAYCELGEGLRTDIVTVIPDITEPILKITSPEDGMAINRSEIMITWEVEDPESEILYNRIRIDSGEWMDIGKNTSYLASNLPDGYHIVSIESVNEIYLSGNEEVGFLVDTTPPTLDLKMDDPAITSEKDFRVRWNAYDEVSKIQRFLINFNGGGWTDIGKDTSYHLTLIREGNNDILVRAVDNAGNQRTVSGTIIYDATPPDINITWPRDGSVHNDQSLTVRWDSNDALTGIDYTELILDGEIRYKTEDRFFTLPFLDEGDHEVMVVSVDNAGNEAEMTVGFFIDRSKPLVTDYFPKGIVTDIDTPVYVDLSEAMDTSTMNISITSINVTVYSIGNRWFISRIGQLVYGERYEVAVTGSDTAGNPLTPFSWNFSVTGEGEIYGIVVDWWGNPVYGADIHINGQRVDRTDMGGNYRFSYQMGGYEILITRDGYEDYTGFITVEPGVSKNAGQSVIRKEEDEDRGLGSFLTVVLILLAFIVIAAGIAFAVIILRKEIRKRDLISMDDREAMIEILKHFGVKTRLDQIDCYETLGLDEDASGKEIKSAYRRLAKRYHPDLMNSYGEDRDEIEVKMREINAAKQILTDPVKRELHDRILKAYGK
ncbi:MAG: NosD domain-containing protein, partial [Thermoplasmatota archaeon]